MKVHYDKATDTLCITLRESPVFESDDGRPGVVLDYDRDGNLVALEILEASRRVERPDSVTVMP